MIQCSYNIPIMLLNATEMFQYSMNLNNKKKRMAMKLRFWTYDDMVISSKLLVLLTENKL